MLIFSGLLFSLIFKLARQEKSELEDPEGSFEEESPQQLSLVALMAVLALGAFAVYNFLIPVITSSVAGVTVTSFFSVTTLPLGNQGEYIGAAIYTIVLIPNAEEQFFRGFIGNLSAEYLPVGLAEVAAGTIFMFFHIAVYSLLLPAMGFPVNLPYMVIIAAAGFTFVTVDIVTHDIATSIFAHMGNNALSFLVGGSIISALIPGLQVPQGLSIMAPVATPAVVFWVVAYRAWKSKRDVTDWRPGGWIR